MKLPRRALLLAAAAAVRPAGAADLPTLQCPLLAEPTVLVPGVSGALWTRLIGAQIYRGLLRWSSDGTLEPDLATAIEVSADGLVYSIALRPGVVWHDSGGFGSADVAFSLQRFHRALQPALNLGRIAVDTPGPLSVVLTLPQPDSAMLGRLTAQSLPIVPRHVHDRAGWALDPKRTTPVGTGPFRLDGWLRLVRFDWYAGPPPSIANIGYPVLPGPAACTALAEAGGPVLLVGDAVDWAAIPHLRALAGVTVEGEASSFGKQIAGLRLNPAARPLDDAEFRLALACAIDRRAALKAGWAGLGDVATSAPSLGGGDGPEALPDYSLRTAADHLRAAGLRPDDDGIRARLTCLHPPGVPWSGMLATIRRSLAQVGVEFTAEAVTAADWERRIASGDYQSAVFAIDRPRDGASAPPAAVGSATPGLMLPLVEPALPVVRPTGLRLARGVFGSFEGAFLD